MTHEAMHTHLCREAGKAVSEKLATWNSPEEIIGELKTKGWLREGANRADIEWGFRVLLEASVSNTNGLTAFEIQFRRRNPEVKSEIFGPLEFIRGLWLTGPGGGGLELFVLPIPGGRGLG